MQSTVKEDFGSLNVFSSPDSILERQNIFFIFILFFLVKNLMRLTRFQCLYIHFL
jgi:hypothetical protein